MVSAICACSRHEVPAPVPEAAEIRFRIAGISVETPPDKQTRADSESPLAEGTTLRVMAYKRIGPAADIENDTFVDQATFVAQADGTLAPCFVDGDGDVTAGDNAQTMHLRAGTYDLYAITPALPVTANKVSVAHGTDYAGSLTTTEIRPGETVKTVALNTLTRHCTRLSFSVTRMADHIASVKILGVTLGRMTRSPIETTAAEPIPEADNTGEYYLPDAAFKVGSELYEAFGADEILPKKDAPFELSMSVLFNNNSEPTALKALIPTMPFAPGYQYNFDISLKGDFILLTLYVLEWTDIPAWDMDDIGQPPVAGIVVGTWQIAGWEDNGMGDYFTPVIKPRSWVPNPEWTADMGDYFSPLLSPDEWSGKDWSMTDIGSDE